MKIKVSIITPVKNCKDTIKKTIESVKSQSYKNIEHIIIDGDSTDGTLEIIKQFENIKLITGPDKSIAEAMNKGIKISTGDIVGILNADDYYLENTIQTIVTEHINEPNSILHGDMRVFGNNKYYDVISDNKPNILSGMVINHPTMFVPLTIINKHGMYDENFNICGDWEMCVRYYLLGLNFKNINKILVHYMIGGVSTTKPGIVFEDMRKIRIKHKLFKYIDFRYYRDKFFLLVFRNQVNAISHKKRMFIFNLKKLIAL